MINMLVSIDTLRYSMLTLLLYPSLSGSWGLYESEETIRFGDIAGQGATLLFVGEASRNILADLPFLQRRWPKKEIQPSACRMPQHQPHWRWQRASIARRTSSARRKPPQNNAVWVSIFFHLHWPILMNYMSTEDDSNLAVCGLIQLRGSAVSSSLGNAKKYR